MKVLNDPRDPERITYSQEHLLWCGMLMFLLHLASRRQLRMERLAPGFLKNLHCLTKTDEKEVADPDTLEYYLRRQDHSHLSILPAKMVQALIRKKVLDEYRFFGRFLIAIDGTRLFTYDQKHCEHCLTMKVKGQLIYYHPVIEAKLVTHNGFAFSIASLFVENPDEYVDKQDCELKAFYRLVPLIKELFPRTPFCLLLDALYLGKPTFDICNNNGWLFIINFKEGSMPALYKEAKTLAELSPDNTLNNKMYQTPDTDKTIKQSFKWVDHLPYEDHLLKAIFSKITVHEETTRFEYITNLDVQRNNVEKIVNQGGRIRWKIENQGFNAQKNEGFELEHAYSQNLNAIKNYYYLLQIAHILFQLMAKGSLFSNFRKQMGSFKNFAKRLAEHFRMILIDLKVLNQQFQIRFNSS